MPCAVLDLRAVHTRRHPVGDGRPHPDLRPLSMSPHSPNPHQTTRRSSTTPLSAGPPAHPDRHSARPRLPLRQRQRPQLTPRTSRAASVPCRQPHSQPGGSGGTGAGSRAEAELVLQRLTQSYRPALRWPMTFFSVYSHFIMSFGLGLAAPPPFSFCGHHHFICPVPCVRKKPRTKHSTGKPSHICAYVRTFNEERKKQEAGMSDPHNGRRAHDMLRVASDLRGC